MKYKTTLFLSVIIIGCLDASCSYILVDEKKTERALRQLSEKAFFEGQRTALSGDIRIKLNSDSCYVWTKSPWNNGTRPLFNPTYLDTKNGVNE